MEQYEKLKQDAQARWEKKYSGKARILVPSADCGRAAGAVGMVEAVQKELQRLGTVVEVAPTGCLGLCHAEPLICLGREGRQLVCYGQVSPERAASLVGTYLAGGQPPSELALGTLDQDRGE